MSHKKRLLTAGALLLLAGAGGSAEMPPAPGPDNTPGPDNVMVSPDLAVLPSPKAVAGPFGFSDPQPPEPAASASAGETPAPQWSAAPTCGAGVAPATPAWPAHACLLAHPGPYPPLGAMMHEHFQIQVNNGIAARMVLYDYDFVCGGDMLNVRGLDRLHQITHWFESHPYPLIIERTPYAPALAEARRLGVLRILGEQGIAVPPGRVLVGPPIAVPLGGMEAELIYLNLLQQTRNRGILGGSGTTGGTGGTGGIPLPGIGAPAAGIPSQ